MSDGFEKLFALLETLDDFSFPIRCHCGKCIPPRDCSMTEQENADALSEEVDRTDDNESDLEWLTIEAELNAVFEELKNLPFLKESGAITEEEYEKKKAKLFAKL